MIQETFVARDPQTLAQACAGLIAAGFVEDQLASAELAKSSATTSAASLRFANVRAVAVVTARGDCSLTFSADQPAALAAALRIVQERPAPGTQRPISALLKSKAQVSLEQAQGRLQARQQRELAATAPAREAQARAAARQEAAWRCTGAAAVAIETRLCSIGAQILAGADGMPMLELGAETVVQITTDPAGMLSTIELTSYSRSDFATAARVITAGPEQVHVYNPAKILAKPMKKGKAKQPVVDLLAASDQELAGALRKLPPRRKAALRKSLERR